LLDFRVPTKADPPERPGLGLSEARRLLTAPKHGWKPLPELIGALNWHLKGWATYYRLGQPRKAFQRLNR
jgi:hypothetical protein